jgi:hypothetical protein
MAGFPGFDPESGFYQGMNEQWGAYTRDAVGTWRNFQKHFAQQFRAALDQQIQEDPWSQIETEFTRKTMESFLELVRTQREARQRFFEMQKSILDHYLELLDNVGRPPGDPSSSETP